MARIRTVKPELFTHADLFDAERETGLPLRLAYIGLWCQADRDGRFKWKPRSLELGVLPFDGLDFDAVLDALVTRGYLVRYASEGMDIGWVVSFTSHQNINNRESESTLPPPPADAIPPTPPGRERKGREGKSREARVRDASLILSLVAVWNEHRGKLPECRSADSYAPKVLAALKAEPDLELWSRVIQWKALDPFWIEKRYTLQNLTRGSNYPGYLDACRNGTPPSPAVKVKDEPHRGSTLIRWTTPDPECAKCEGSGIDGRFPCRVCRERIEVPA